MALRPCRECARLVSTEAPLCPQCGAPAPAHADGVRARTPPGEGPRETPAPGAMIGASGGEAEAPDPLSAAFITALFIAITIAGIVMAAIIVHERSQERDRTWPLSLSAATGSPPRSASPAVTSRS